jgi:energy-coupling factor transporter ATP-binding protein EcfA2
MQLIGARITNFRSVEDSGEFRIEAVTCLVGKNEAGKSAVLMALAALNPHPATPLVLNKERDYPRRHLTNYSTRHPAKEAVAVKTVWELEPAEIAVVAEEFGPNVLKAKTVEIVRRYGGQPEWSLPLDFDAAFDHLLSKFKLSAAERAPLKSASNSQDLIKTLKEIGSPTEKHQALLAQMQAYGTVTAEIIKRIEKYFPKFMYFSNYDRMDGAIQIDDTMTAEANGQLDQEQFKGKKLFKEFLDYSGVPLKEIIAVNTYETFNARLEAASNNITDQILEYWTQNPDLSVEVKVEQARSGDPPPFNIGTIARARIRNQLHRVDTPFSERSAGFVWFFSFLVKFAQVKDDATPVVLLLDEPGLTLHGKAQGDLLRFFDEKLAPYHQIIYSTHSPFMVAPDRLMSSRIVEDQVEIKNNRRSPLGTKVREDVLERDPDTLFPLQGALGYEITQSLFVGKNTLLVEGPGDIIYLHALSDALRRRKRTILDPRWTLCPAGGIDKIRPFVALFGGNKLNIAVLTDQGANEKKKVEDLRRADVLKAGHFYSIVEFVNKPEADIEDIFAPELFVKMLNDCYRPPKGHEVTVAKLEATDTTTPRLVKKAEALFRVMPDTVDSFNHFAPADWLLRNPDLLDANTPAVSETLGRAEVIFKTFNKLLA